MLEEDFRQEEQKDLSIVGLHQGLSWIKKECPNHSSTSIPRIKYGVSWDKTEEIGWRGGWFLNNE